MHSCAHPGEKPKCDLTKGKDDYEKFNLLLDCLVERKVYHEVVKNYYECLEKSFSEG